MAERRIRKECKTLFQTIDSNLDDIRQNHLAHLQTDVQVLSTDVGWIKKGMLGIMGFLGAILLALVASLLA